MAVSAEAGQLCWARLVVRPPARLSPGPQENGRVIYNRDAVVCNRKGQIFVDGGGVPEAVTAAAFAALSGGATSEFNLLVNVRGLQASRAPLVAACLLQHPCSAQPRSRGRPMLG